MKVLVVGGGGREHTLVWKISKSKLVSKIYCAPGNAGIRQLAECVQISATDINGLLKFADQKHIDLTIVGPEAPLSLGIVDTFQNQGLKIFGPSKKAAEIESSKIFSKYVMEKYHIPTARYEAFDVYDRAIAYLKSSKIPVVIKADGLAAGKGAIVCFTKKEAQEALKKLMVDQIFGDAGKKVIIEEFLQGEEVSVLAFTDGTHVLPLTPAQDHKPILDGDKGPNTGGMGAYAPAVFADQKLMETVIEKVLKPAVRGLSLEDCPYRGVLYAGLMMTADGPKVIEFNCRFGDPETQAILPLMKNDIIPVINACIDGNLNQIELETAKKFAVCVIMASGGYPEKYEKNKKIIGLDHDFSDDIIVFHSGTKFAEGHYLTDGGRVLGVTAVGSSVKQTHK